MTVVLAIYLTVTILLNFEPTHVPTSMTLLL